MSGEQRFPFCNQRYGNYTKVRVAGIVPTYTRSISINLRRKLWPGYHTTICYLTQVPYISGCLHITGAKTFMGTTLKSQQ